MKSIQDQVNHIADKLRQAEAEGLQDFADVRDWEFLVSAVWKNKT